MHDLSAKDPYYILPVAMVITSCYLMTKMTPMPATTDPAQQRMMLLMPVFMGFIFFNLSSGLNLYYFASNLGNVAAAVVSEPHSSAAFAEQIQEEQKQE